jgi:hypothetical protein
MIELELEIRIPQPGPCKLDHDHEPTRELFSVQRLLGQFVVAAGVLVEPAILESQNHVFVFQETCAF